MSRSGTLRNFVLINVDAYHVSASGFLRDSSSIFTTYLRDMIIVLRRGKRKLTYYIFSSSLLLDYGIVHYTSYRTSKHDHYLTFVINILIFIFFFLIMPLIFSSSPNLDYFIFLHTLNPQGLEFRYKRLYFNIHMLIFQIEYQRYQYLKIQSLKD